MAVVEYTILIAIAICGASGGPGTPPWHLPHHQTMVQLVRDRREGQSASGLLIAVFIYSGWDGTLYVNEEVKHRRANPGKAAVYGGHHTHRHLCLD